MNLNQEEKQIIDYIENQNPQSISNLKEEIDKYTNLAKNYVKKENIQIQIPINDLYLLKQKALKKGINYQNIIQLLVHKYIHSGINL